MTIEQRCNKTLENFNYPYPDYTIEYWVWNKENVPLSLSIVEYHKFEVNIFRGDKIYAETAIMLVDNAICEADETECLTSRSEYIRVCKKWMMKNDYKATLSKLLDDFGKSSLSKKKPWWQRFLK